MNDNDQSLPSAEAVATQTTDLVVRYLAQDDPVIAGALQPIARAAWGLVADGTGMIELHHAAREARTALRLTFCPPRITAFVDAVAAYAEGSAPADWEWDDEEVDENPYLAICPEIGLEETLRLAELSSLYLRAAGIFSEVTVASRALGAAWDASAERESVANALALVADHVETAAELIDEIVLVLAMSANTATGPLHDHMDDLRDWPDHLRLRARWIRELVPGEPTSEDEFDTPADGIRAAARECEHWIDVMLFWGRAAREVGMQIAPFSGR